MPGGGKGGGSTRFGILNRLGVDPGVRLGFSDAGAHLRNTAFYNFGLRFLRRVHRAEQAGPFMTRPARQVLALNSCRMRAGSRLAGPP
ncbi:hypothetical protein FNL39_103221 [Nocardia caishijiensis]|uniref:Tn3 transposase DDE domain-containing protein n=1 Tax=Nocardia caishijiensis TaxID=184756 RepID=A0ABQ6YNS8_9NOCA|nr:hypothetical protein FNL39_103221 [Nocardia caishijiensis]